MNISFRNCKLTNLLKDSLLGKSYILLIACISLDSAFINDSISTLKFANNLKSIKTQNLKRGISETESAKHTQYIQRIAQLEKEKGKLEELLMAQ